MNSGRYLTGITTTGIPHLGNYVGAIRPAIEASRYSEEQAFYFLADYHALVKCQIPDEVQSSTRQIAAAWLASGLDVERATLYRQSDIPEIAELAWILSCVAAKGMLNRAHAYKASVQSNVDVGDDADKAISMGLYSYPILMAADILIFKGRYIPVGRDQIQHVEMARDIAQRFNYLYGDTFVLPEAVVNEDAAVLTGLDGRKMSKSYGNTVPLFSTEKALKKGINKIKTNVLEPGEPKEYEGSIVAEFWEAFATPDQIEYMKDQFRQGIAWGQSKVELFELINSHLKPFREDYLDLTESPHKIEEILQYGAERARNVSQELIAEVRDRVGIRPL